MTAADTLILLVIGLGGGIAVRRAFRRIRALYDEIDLLRRRVTLAEETLAKLGAKPGDVPPPVAEAPPAETVAAAPPPAPPLPSAEPPPPSPPQPPSKRMPADGGLERMLSEHWLVWLGGVALALGGAFLVKYSVEQGWLGPAVRVALGGLLGMGLIALGHRLSDRPAALDRLPGGIGPSHVPPALVGAGVSTLFASLYAAYGLYGLIPPAAAFAMLSLVAVAAALLSLRHGPFVALLGLLGGFLVPALVQSGHPRALALFSYLLALTAGGVVLLRWRQWWWLAWVSLAGGMGWTLLWLALEFHPGDEAVLGLFLLAQFGLFAAFRLGIPTVPALAGRARAPGVGAVVTAATITTAVLIFWLTLASGGSATAVLLLLLFDLAVLVFSRHDQSFDALPAVSAALSALVLAAWELTNVIPPQLPGWWSPPLPPDAHAFALTAAAVAALFGGGGYVALRGAAQPWRWAAVSAGMMVAADALAYWRLSASGVDSAWSAGTLALAALLLAACQQVAHIRRLAGMEAALGTYAVGVIAAIALAATLALRQAWLTVALAATVAGIAWVYHRLRIAGLRQTALILAAVILIRLLFNPSVLDYPLGDTRLVTWLLYGYGLPAAAFAVAAHLFRRAGEDRTTQTLEAGAILFAVLLVSLEIHDGLETERVWGLSYSLAERSWQTVAWLVMAAGLTLLSRRSGRPVPGYAGWILLGLATLQAVLAQAWLGNPYLTGEEVGHLPIFNLLLPAFGLPAALYALHAALAPPASALRLWCGRLGLVFALLWLTLEVRRAFTGGDLTGDTFSTVAELYAYSLAWLGYAGAALAAGIRWKVPALRRWGLGVLSLVVGKAFLIDMAELTGLWRVLSFLGLGAALMAVGWLYRRFDRPGAAVDNGKQSGPRPEEGAE